MQVPQSYFDYTRGRESSGNVYAKNPRSSATGLYQFTEGTWNDLARKYPQLQLSADGRLDPAQQERAMRQFTQDNADFLGSRGYQPTTSNLYLAHRFGPQGALQLLTADQNAPVASVVSPAVMKANPDLNNKTVASLTVGSNTPELPPGAQPVSFSPKKDVPALYAQGSGAEGAQAMAQPSTVFPSKREVPPALYSAQGPGALSEDSKPFITPERMSEVERAGVYLMGITDPKALGALSALKDNDAYSLVQGQDGSMYRLRKQDGKVERVQAGDPARKANEAYDAKMAEAFAEQNNKMSAAADEARSLQGTLRQARSLINDPNVYQGFGGDWANRAKSFLKAAGVSNAEGLDNAQLLNAISKEMTLKSRSAMGGMPGSLSDSDRRFLEEANVNLSNDREANLKIVDRHDKIAQRVLEADRMRQEHVARHGRLNEGFRVSLSKHAEENPLFKEEIAAATRPAQQSTPSSAYKVIKVH